MAILALVCVILIAVAYLSPSAGRMARPYVNILVFSSWFLMGSPVHAGDAGDAGELSQEAAKRISKVYSTVASGMKTAAKIMQEDEDEVDLETYENAIDTSHQAYMDMELGADIDGALANKMAESILEGLQSTLDEVKSSPILEKALERNTGYYPKLGLIYLAVECDLANKRLKRIERLADSMPTGSVDTIEITKAISGEYNRMILRVKAKSFFLQNVLTSNKQLELQRIHIIIAEYKQKGEQKGEYKERVKRLNKVYKETADSYDQLMEMLFRLEDAMKQLRSKGEDLVAEERVLSEERKSRQLQELVAEAMEFLQTIESRVAKSLPMKKKG